MRKFDCHTIENLGVRCTSVVKHSDFYDELRNFPYPFVFISSFMQENAKHIINELGLNSKLVLLTEFGEVAPSQNIRTLSMPVHSVSIANILNNVADNIGYSKSYDIDIRFTAPTAKVLIVDDIDTNLKVAKGLMAPYKMQVDTCLSGLKAIELIQIYRYDAIFMDHMMPEMDGVEASNLIRSLADEGGYYKKVPIIALTANAVSGIKEMFLQNGLNDFLTKPIETFKLNSILEKWIPHEKREKYIREEKVDVAYEIEIKGIDIKTGISMTGGKLKHYLSILSIFHKDGLEKIIQISKCVKENDIKLYTTYVHAMKSATASIGAAKISDFAKTLELAGINEDVEFIEKNTGDFIRDLTILLKNINVAISNAHVDDKKENNSDLEFLYRNLDELKVALENMDVREIDNIINLLKVEEWDNRIKDTLGSIEESILLFEYDEAIELIDKLLAQNTEIRTKD